MTVNYFRKPYSVVCRIGLCLVLSGGLCVEAGLYSWNTAQATVLAQGDLEWAPLPFVFTPGVSVRYIDFENGDDANDGLSTNTAWKHHPWDPNASGVAASGGGAHTYVFKRGVIYRGQLLPNNSGTSANPIRLTSDPNWGTGEAWLYGSEQVTNWTQGPGGVNPSIPSPSSVWYADLAFLPRMVCMVDATGAVTRLALAREPDWTITDPLDPLKNCWLWQGHMITNTGSGNRHLRWGYSGQLDNPDPNYYTGGLVWTEWGNLMSAPYAAPIEAYDAGRKGIVFQGPWWNDSGQPMIIHQRYWIEDKPHYLDSPGEFWFERTGASSGRLYVRLPGDIPPTNVTVEAARHISIIYKYLGTMNYVEISGLSFRFVNIYWPLHYREFEDYPATQSAAIHFEGTGVGLSVRNCRFEYVPAAVRFRAYQTTDRMDGITVADNDIRYCDHGAIDVWDGTGYNQAVKPGSLGSVRILRNRIRNTGLRPYRVNGHHTVNIQFPRVAEIAGNILEEVGGAGLFIFGGKSSTTTLNVPYDAPLTRILIHHNKVKHALLCANDWGAIETWQGGSFYVYNNVSWNPIGPMNYAPNRFAGAYYLDGSFKNYYFNNIAWGARQYLLNQYVEAGPGFQEVIGYLNTIANNSVFRFRMLSRRQEGDAGRNKYLGNILDSNTTYVFDHTVSSSSANYDTLAFDYNVVGRQTATFGTFEYGGASYSTLAAFANALRARKATASAVGVATNGLIFENADTGDMRPRATSPAINFGVRHFVPWALFTTVGEWHFVRSTNTPAIVIDESWYMVADWTERSTYRTKTTFPLTGVNITNSNFISGPLEDWCHGAVRLNGTNQYFSGNGNGPYNKSLDIGTNGFIIEVFFRTVPDHVGGVLACKVASAGYSLRIDANGCARFAIVLGGTDTCARTSGVRVNDGDWHHVLVEYHRPVPSRLNMYVDGVLANGATVGTLPTPGVWITNSAPFIVGRGPIADYFAGDIEFVRVARGTLTNAVTTIEELYDWQFAGPMLADFRGVPPNGRRDAGALELAYAGELLPRITRQPTNIVIDLGMAGGARVGVMNATFAQWLKDGTELLGATNYSLAFSAAQGTDAGTYIFVVSNVAGVVTSAPIVVAVIPEPAVWAVCVPVVFGWCGRMIVPKGA
ncbi:MAG: LamG domain-containing protein [bacterium]|nr:LamG domain-containing protein [bacterium]